MANSNTLRLSNLKQSSTKFFDIAFEIREIIYDLVLDYSDPTDDIIFPNPFSNVKTQYAVFDKPDHPDIEEPEPAQGLKPSKLSLAMTCRQAYREASRFYYSRHHFGLHSGYMLNRFVKDLQPILIQMIKQLSIVIRTRRKEVGYGYNKFSMQENRGSLSLAIIEHFHGLEELHFACEDPPDHPCKGFLQFLAVHASGLKQLKYMVVHSFSVPRINNNYKNFKLDPAELPGWTYQVRIGYQTAMVYEILKPIPENFSGNTEELPTYNITCELDDLVRV